MKFIFGVQINIEVFYKLILSFWQYLKKELSDEVDFLHAGKHESLLQIDSMILMAMVKYHQSSNNSKFAFLYNISKKK